MTFWVGSLMLQDLQCRQFDAWIVNFARSPFGSVAGAPPFSWYS